MLVTDRLLTWCAQRTYEKVENDWSYVHPWISNTNSVSPILTADKETVGHEKYPLTLTKDPKV
jgi:hypothetical protein